MSKDDAPVPEAIPRKRRQIESVPALWIAQWLARDDLSPGDRKRLAEEKDRRKRLSPDRVLGFIDNPAGATPEQKVTLRDYLLDYRPTKVLHARFARGRGAASKFHGIALSMKLPIEIVDEREICKQADVVVATPNVWSEPPRRMDSDEGMWGPIRYARHRGVPVKIILPDGQINEGE